MNLVHPSIEVSSFNTSGMLQGLEAAIRTCYKSEDRITEDSARDIIERMIASGHHSTLEHASITARIICDRGVTHEIVRHRLVAYSQESTRYCNYSKAKFGNALTFVIPLFWSNNASDHELVRTKNSLMYNMWLTAMARAEQTYLELIEHGAAPQEARSVLPNSLKTEIVMTANLREWMHIFRLRCSAKAHPQMRQVMIPLKLFLERTGLDILFKNIPFDTDFPTRQYASVEWAKK